MAQELGRLDFAAASLRVAEIEKRGARVLAHAEVLAAQLRPTQCTRRRRVVLGWGPIIAAVAPITLVRASSGCTLFLHND